jgi:hypothetical protein
MQSGKYTRAPERASSKQGFQREPIAPDVMAMARWLSFAPPNTFDLLDEAHRRWPDMSLRDFRAAHYLAAAMLMPTEGTA